ncbi:MAG TPA: flagellar biosynthesis protein FlhF [Candidatus Hydrogenedentes bacterium]|nr:flagellar biosynthesis protein FlhF [Candidatus Hydrogenedentota bacterium]HOS02306.1 flagellar biosynthesis protein FlhF [Candidatus Hydrogenedentota bacterium]
MAQKLHTFQAETLDGAYRQMREKLGQHAVVLRTRQVKQSGFLGWIGRKQVELTAAEPVAPPPGPRRPTPVDRHYASASRIGSDQTVRESVTYFKELVSDAQRRMGIAASSAPSAPVRSASHPAPPHHPPVQSHVSASSGRRHPHAGVSGDNAPRASAVGDSTAPAPHPVIPFPKPKDDSSETLRRELRELRNLVEVLIAEAPGAGLPPEFAPHYRALIDNGVSRPVAASLMGSLVKGTDLSILRDPQKLQDRLRQEVAARIKIANGIARKPGSVRVAALVGPTGVGKTTNVAKLAAVYAVRQRARVALITADTYRVAAPEQLRTYANIIGLPLQVVNTPKDMAGAVRLFRDQDIVLIDTAGGSPYNLKQMQELVELLDAAQPHETFLVLGATTPLEDLRAVVDKFKPIAPTSLLFTKLDETQRYGALFSVLAESGLPASYLSVGQNVPEDLLAAKAEAIAALIVKGGEKRGISSPKSA